MLLQFSKMEGLGNDFIILDDRTGELEKSTSLPALAARICDRHFGVGADGIILISESDTCDLKFRIFNSDGSVAQMCGNGMRCYAKYVYENGIVSKKTITVETLAGVITPEIILNRDGRTVDSVKVDMGEPVLETSRIPFVSENSRAVSEVIDVDGADETVTAVSMGNPHAVIFVDDLASVSLEKRGRKVELHEKFPEKTNVEFVEVISESELRMKVWERGAGVTLACGTGACAVLVAAILSGRTGDSAVVHLPGGDLSIEWNRENNHIYKTGPANLVFTGTMTV